MNPPADDPALPYRSPMMARWFQWYSRRYARKHFHAVRLSRSSPALPRFDGKPLLFVLNHPSWWDIITGIVLAERFPDYTHYVPIEAAMLAKYRIFTKLGFFGVESTPRGAARFLRTSRAIFERPWGAMWITAQGKFVDPRVRPIEFQPGVGAIISKLSDGWIVPVGIEYPFWDERTPEALIRFGEPIVISGGIDGREWTTRMEEALTSTLDVLAREAMSRDPAVFETIVTGKVGVGGPYDWWRRCKSWMRGRKFDAAHREDVPKQIAPRMNTDEHG